MRKYLLLLLIPAMHACNNNATTYDTIIRNAMIYDGNGGLHTKAILPLTPIPSPQWATWAAAKAKKKLTQREWQ